MDSSSIEQSWQQVEELAKDGCIVEITVYGDLSTGVDVFTGSRNLIVSAGGDTPTQAINKAAAAVKAKIAQYVGGG